MTPGGLGPERDLGKDAQEGEAQDGKAGADDAGEAAGGEAGLLSEPRFWAETATAISVVPGLVAKVTTPVWASTARPAQLPPPGDWRNWLIVGGRGSGKTRAGAEWVRAMAYGIGPMALRPHGRIALVAETLGDAREVMIDGESGIVRVSVAAPPVFETSRRRLVFGNGAIAQIFSSEDPDALRGYQFDAAWGDELAKWVHGEACFDNLQMALRLGVRPWALFTTTPRPIPLMKRLLGDPDTVRTHMRTAENAENLAPGFMATMRARYGGSRLGRQELEGELIEAREDALFDVAAIDRCRVRAAPELRRVVVAVEPRLLPADGAAAGEPADRRPRRLARGASRRAGPASVGRSRPRRGPQRRARRAVVAGLDRRLPHPLGKAPGRRLRRRSGLTDGGQEKSGAGEAPRQS